MERLFFFILFTILTSNVATLNAQIESSTELKRAIYNEQFNDNRNDWYLGNKIKTNSVIANGVFHFQSKVSDMPFIRYQKINISEVESFEIKIKIKQTEGANAYGLRWGGSKDSSHVFYLDNTGRYSIGKCSKHDYTEPLQWQGTETIKPDDFNTLKVRKERSSLSYFINNELITTHKFKTIFGDRIGFIVPYASKIEIDYLTIYSLDSKTNIDNISKNSCSNLAFELLAPFSDTVTENQSYKVVVKIYNDENFDISLNNVSQNYYTLTRHNGYKIIEKTITLKPGNNNLNITAGNYTERRKIVYNSTNDIIPPEIEITYPVVRGVKPILREKQVTIKGIVTDESGIFEILINEHEASVDANGNFSKTILLAYGDNFFTVTATDIEQNTSTKEFSIQRESEQYSIDIGIYYAIIIGVSDYTDPQIPDLNNRPTEDAQALKNTLVEYYTFEEENIKLLENPTRRQIIRAFNEFEKEITEKDNFLIFYAGHGDYEESNDKGYWIPSDAEYGYTDGFIYNSTLVDEIDKINSMHTLLISDACFSGSIFKTRALPKDSVLVYQKKYKLKSRNAITSGTLKTVLNESVFFEYLNKKLIDNNQKYMSASELFHQIEIPVSRNSPNIPQFGDIQNVGDEGGDFIFIRR